MRSPPLTCISFSPFLSFFVLFFFLFFVFLFVFLLHKNVEAKFWGHMKNIPRLRDILLFFFFYVNSNWKYNKNVELWSNSTINPNTTNTKIIFFLTLKMRFLIARYTEEQFSLLFPVHFWMDLLKYYTTLECLQAQIAKKDCSASVSKSLPFSFKVHNRKLEIWNVELQKAPAWIFLGGWYDRKYYFARLKALY